MGTEEDKKRVRSLSSGLQGMRFMQRKREREIRKNLSKGQEKLPDKPDGDGEAEETAVASPEAPAPFKSTNGGFYVIDESRYGGSLETVGRRSFKKFNPAFDEGRSQKAADKHEPEATIDKQSTLSASEIALWREKYVTGSAIKSEPIHKKRRLGDK